MDIGHLVAHLGADLKDLERGMARARKLLDDYEKTTGKELAQAESRWKKHGAMVGKQVEKMGKKLFSLRSAFMTLGGFFIVNDIVQTGAKFEQTMTRVKAVTKGITDNEFRQMNELVRDLGKTTEWTAVQVAEGMQYLSMAGFKAAESLKALPQMLDLATAGSIDLGRAADIATNVLTSMRMPVEQLTRVNDVFIETMTSSNVNMEQMAESFKYAGAVGAAFGYRVEQISALIGKLGNAGVQGSMAGTQLSFAFQKVGKAFKYYNEQGVNTTKYTKDLIGVLQLLSDKSATADDIMKMFGQRAGRGVAALMGQGIVSIKAFIKELEKAEGRTKEIAEEFRSTTIGRWRVLKSAMDDVKIELFQQNTGALNEALMEMSEYVRNNSDKFVEFGNVIVETAKDLLPIVLAIGKFFASALAGWSSLPLIVQELGIVGAVIGGKKAMAALLLIGRAIDEINKLNKANEVYRSDETTTRLEKILENENRRLEQLKKSKEALSGDDITIFGPKINMQIEQVQEHIKITTDKLNEFQYAAERANVQLSALRSETYTDKGLKSFLSDIKNGVKDSGKLLADVDNIIANQNKFSYSKAVEDLLSALREKTELLSASREEQELAKIIAKENLFLTEQEKDAILKVVKTYLEKKAAIKATEKAAKVAAAELKKEETAVRRLFASTLTPIEKLEKKLKDIGKLFESGAFFREFGIDEGAKKYVQAVNAINNEMISIKVKNRDLARDVTNDWDEAARNIHNIWTDLFSDLFSGRTVNFSGLITSLGNALTSTVANEMPKAFSAFAMEASSDASGIFDALGAGLDAINLPMLGVGVGLSMFDNLFGREDTHAETERVVNALNELRLSVDANTTQQQNQLHSTSPQGGDIASLTTEFFEKLRTNVFPDMRTMYWAGDGRYGKGRLSEETKEYILNLDISDMTELFRYTAQYHPEEKELYKNLSKAEQVKTGVSWIEETGQNVWGWEEGIAAGELALGYIEEYVTELSLLTINTSDALSSGLQSIIDSIDNVDVAENLNRAIEDQDFKFPTTAFEKAKQDFINTYGEYDQASGKYVSGLRKDMETQIEQQQTIRSTMGTMEKGSALWEQLNASLISEEELNRIIAGFDLIEIAGRSIDESFAKDRTQAIEDSSRALAEITGEFTALDGAIETVKETFQEFIDKALDAGASMDDDSIQQILADQSSAIASTFRIPWEEIVNTEGLTEYELGLREVNKWHEENVKVLKEEGMYLDENGNLTSLATLEVSAFNVKLSELTDDASTAATALDNLGNRMTDMAIQTAQAAMLGTSEVFSLAQAGMKLGWQKMPSTSDLASQISFAATASPAEIRQHAASLGLSTETFLDSISLFDEAMDGLTESTTSTASASNRASDSLKNYADALKSQISSIEMIDDLLYNLRGGGDLAPVTSFEFFEKRYAQLMGKAQETLNERDVQAVTDFTYDYLDFAKTAGGDYATLANQVISDFEALEMEISGGKTLDDLYQQLEETNAKLGSIQSSSGATASGIASALGKALNQLYDSWETQAVPGWETANVNMEKVSASFFDAISSALGSAGGQGFETAEGKWGEGSGINITESGEGYMVDFYGAGMEQFGSLFFESLSEVTDQAIWNLISANEQWLNNITTKEKWQVPSFASGGTFSPGLNLVGEKGPELMYSSNSGRVISNSETTSMIADAVSQALSQSSGKNSGTITVNLVIAGKAMEPIVLDVANNSQGFHKAIQRHIKAA